MRSDTIIRAARVGDLYLLHPMIERAYRGESARQGWTHEADLLEGERTSLDILEGIVADPAQRLLVAIRSRRPIGCVAVSHRGGDLAYLGQLCVEPTLQTAGLGRRLIAAAEATAVAAFKATRIEMTVIDSRTELIDYYVRRGYRQTDERRDFPLPVDPPLYMTVLEKPLSELAVA